MVLQEGMQIREYRLIRQLGEGGMGIVWLADDINMGRKIALKVLFDHLSANNAFVERFKQEARIQSNLVHPNIVDIYAFFIYEDSYIIVMQYAPGISLSELIAKVGPIPFERCRRIFLQLLEALWHTHEKGIIHRDLKPSNIMIDVNNDDAVKVMDFGIAKAFTDLHLTKTGSQVGTLFYMSPEQIKDSRNIDNRSDIYSLGIVLYEMLTGRKPFDTDTDSTFDIQSKIVFEPLPDPTIIYPYIPSSIVQVLNKMCEKDPANRFSSINEIQKVLKGQIPVPSISQIRAEPQIKTKSTQDDSIGHLNRKLLATGFILLTLAIMMVVYILASRKPEVDFTAADTMMTEAPAAVVDTPAVVDSTISPYWSY